MKKYLLFMLLVWFTFSTVNAAVEDNSIIDELKWTDVKTLNSDFKLKSFNSCDNMETVMGDYIKTYWRNNKTRFYNYPMYNIKWWIMVDDMLMETTSDTVASSVTDKSNTVWAWLSSDDYGKTNTQVDWVDESDIIKTDGKNIYYYNDSDHFVYIVSVDDKAIIKKIKIPESFYNPVLYLWNNTLTIISSWYSNYDYSAKWYYINRNNKTYVIVFNIANVSSPKLEKLYITDGDYSQSRKIGDYIYVISNNSFNIPYYNFKTVDDIDFSISKVMPQKIDISKTSVKANQNLKVKWTTLPYNVTAWNVADCSDISYVLPDEETIKQYDFNPSYNVISVIDTKNTNKKVETTVIAWSNNEVYMSLDNLYLTSQMYESYDFVCPMNARCFAPWYSRWANTLLHKLNVSGLNLNYQDSTIIPWTPLTQYSMDEYKTDFRILTQTNNWNTNTNESHTDLYILNKDLWLKSSLKNLWNWEQFKSSRYIWDKLFLVTFKQVDPLYAIDVSDSTTPKILWELKIPGYSTYLHPYDENHLIGLWYDTKENEWWGTVNSWIKVDLYEINYDKKCSDSNLTTDEKTKCDSWEYKWIIVKQKYSKTFWGNWSSSEALSNPRMFMWKASDKKLFLPVSLYQNDATDIYRYTDFFNWLLVLSIDKSSWIKENYRITHIDTSWLEQERINECSKYTSNNTSNTCTKLINWEEYCESKVYSYVPKYCYADSTIWEYIASRSWNYYQDFIKRWLWIGDNSYAVSNSYVSANNISTWKEVFKLKLK